MPTKKKTELPEEMTTPVEAPKLQTETDPELTQMLSDEESGAVAASASGSQTEPESAEDPVPSENAREIQAPDIQFSQTEPEPAKKTRRRRKTDETSTQSDTEADADKKGVTDGVENSAKPRKKRATTRPAATVLSIDDRPTVETEADKAKNDLLDLIESQRSGRILTGSIQGVERPEDNPNLSFAVLYHGEFKVIIPATEAVDPPGDYRGRNPDDVHHYMLTKRLGAEVDYIVKGIDPKSGIAAASRLDAMRARRKEYYFGTDRQ